jgi:hypothetical protein
LASLVRGNELHALDQVRAKAALFRSAFLCIPVRSFKIGRDLPQFLLSSAVGPVLTFFA